MIDSLHLAFRLLLHNPRRLLMASLSVSVGVLIMLLELALLTAVLNSQARIADLARGDLIVMNSARIDMHRWNTMDRVELERVAAVAGVEKVMPVYEFHVALRNPDDHRVRRIILLAFDPEDMPLAVGDPQQVRALLRKPGGILFDELSRPIYGAITPGMDVEVDNVPVQVKGLVRIGPDIIDDGNIVVSSGDWLARSPNTDPMLGIVRLRPGADLEQVRAEILAATHGDLVALTPGEAHAREVASIVQTAPIGLLFGLGAIAGFIIGVINCYQLLYTEVSDHLAQYATLKAIGAPDGFLRGVVLCEAGVLSFTGFSVGFAGSWIVDFLVRQATMLPVQVQAETASLVFLATVGMCLAGGWISLHRVAAADPAALY